MIERHSPLFRLRGILLAGAALLSLSACASNPSRVAETDYSGLSRVDAQDNLGQLSAAYKKRPRDKSVLISYAAALRTEGQAEQATSVLENAIQVHPKDPDIRVAYAKALTASGRFEQALRVLDAVIDPAAPDADALSVKGAVLDQMGQNAAARALYTQALLINPEDAGLEANLGLSYAMTNELDAAEAHLRRAVTMRGASSQIRQNLALVLGLQGRFEESRAIYGAELPPDQVEANMAYIRALLTQQNRWDAIAQDSAQG